MTKEQYERLAAPYQKENRIKGLQAADQIITALIFFSYPALLSYLLVKGYLWEAAARIAIPATSFFLVSLFRKRYSAPRPYEVWEIKPLIHKETEGRSFPSRHVFSAFIIGMSFFGMPSFPMLRLTGILIGMLGTIMAYIRVVSGVHFFRDIAVGAGIGILFGMPYVLWN